ncbi:hypothetical protein [Enterobacter sp. Bisph1]|uniref:hypothetical protein n=1 Tax=Enterobacter sp. Bisph1 TaxID=1274399 RepID=UPI00068D50CD|nr:hypothetical protein [Enterobacter sp. Bisph1]
MPVNLKRIPALANRPQPPVWWRWLLLLIAMLLGGMAYTIWNNISAIEINSEAFWDSSVGVPLTLWLILLAARITWYHGKLTLAKSLDNDRNIWLGHELQRGQRFLNVFAMSLHSPLREPDDLDGKKQWDDIQGKVRGLKTQPSWKSHEGVRHSRLTQKKGESAGQILSRGLNKTLEDLSIALSYLPHETPLDLLLESNSSLPESDVEEIWQNSWTASHIRQSFERIDESGLAAVDKWLDDPRNAGSLLMIIAFQITPEEIEGSAESIVGLLVGHKALSPLLVPLARLHRPELMYHTSSDDFHYALKQSMEWVPVVADTVKNGFIVGVSPGWHMAIAQGLQAVQSPINVGQDMHDLGATLGYPGPAAPWVAIACAAEACQHSDSQLIVSGDYQDDTPLWVTMVTPPQKATGMNSRSPKTRVVQYI